MLSLVVLAFHIFTSATNVSDKSQEDMTGNMIFIYFLMYSIF